MNSPVQIRSRVRHPMPSPFLCLLAVGIAGSLSALARSPQTGGIAGLANAPLYFETLPTAAPTGPQFVARSPDCDIALSPAEAAVNVTTETAARARPAFDARLSAPAPTTRTVRMILDGADARAAMKGVQPAPGQVNYLVGNPSAWRTHLALFTRVQVKEVYPGIDLVYYADQSGRLEYDFTVQPGARPEQISWRVAGADAVRINAAGDLVFTINGAHIRQHKPVIYQNARSGRKEIPGGYVVGGGKEVRFQIGEYDRSLPLIIDPTLTFSTFLGGSRKETAWGVARDDSGIYVTGETLSKHLATTPGAFDHTYGGGLGSFGDAFVAKYDSTSNSLVYLTYLGGGRDDAAMAIAVDDAGSAFVTGFTDSPGFPLTSNALVSELTGRNNNAFHLRPVDAFVTKLSPDGSAIEFSTLLGGNARDAGYGIAVEGTNVYVAGMTESSNFFPILPTAYQTNIHSRPDAFVTKLGVSGTNVSVEYATYLGGERRDQAESIFVANGKAYVTGFTSSTNFPHATIVFTNAGTNLVVLTGLNGNGRVPGTDAFVSRFSADGSLESSVVLGGTGDDSGRAITVDGSGNAYVTGSTSSKNFPTNTVTTNVAGVLFGSDNFNSHVFVAVIAADGSNLLYSTQFGGGHADHGTGIALDAANNIYVAGFSSSKKFFPTNAMFTDLRAASTNAAGEKIKTINANNAFVAVLTSDLSSFVSTNSVLIGGAGDDRARGIVLDPSNVVAHVVGSTRSRNFPRVNPVQPKLGGDPKTKSADAFVSRIEWP